MKKAISKTVNSFEKIISTFSKTATINSAAVHKNRNKVFFESYNNQKTKMDNNLSHNKGFNEKILSYIGESMSISELIQSYFKDIHSIEVPHNLQSQVVYSKPIMGYDYTVGDILILRTTPKISSSDQDNGRAESFQQPIIYVGSDERNIDLGITVSDSTKKVILKELNDIKRFYSRRLS